MISPEELARLWRSHAQGLLLLCRARCQEAEDCVQEAFIRLAAQDPAPDDPLAWLSRVARNEAITRCRAAERRQARERVAGQQRMEWFRSESPLGASMATESLAALEAGLRQLDRETLEIVVAHVWGGLTFRQISAAFGMPRSTVNRRYHEGLASLKTLLVDRSEWSESANPLGDEVH